MGGHLGRDLETCRELGRKVEVDVEVGVSEVTREGAVIEGVEERKKVGVVS